MQGIRFPRSISGLQGTRLHLGFSRLFFVRLGVLHASGLHGLGLEKVIFPSIKSCFGAFCGRCLPFRLAGTRGHIIHRVHTSVKDKHRVGHLLRKSIKDKGALITLLSVLLTISGRYRTYVVTPARVLTARRCTAIVKFLGSVSVGITLLANSAGGGRQGGVLPTVTDKRVRLIVKARTLVRRAIIFSSLNLTVVSRRRHFKIRRHSQL